MEEVNQRSLHPGAKKK